MTTDATLPRRRFARMFQMRMPVMLTVVAGAALIFWAARFHLENRDAQTSWVSRHLRDLAEGDKRQRRIAAETLSNAPAAQVETVTFALVAACRDHDAEVHRLALRSLATLLRSEFERTEGTIPAGHAAAVKVMLASLRHKNSQVQLQAIASLVTLEMTQFTTWSVVGKNKVPTTTRLGADPEAFADELFVLIDDPDDTVAASAVRALQGQQNPSLTDALPRLVTRARRSLQKLDPKREPGQQNLLTGVVTMSLDRDEAPVGLVAMLEDATDLPSRLAMIRAIRSAAGEGGARRRIPQQALTAWLADRLAADDPHEKLDLMRAMRSLSLAPSHTVPILIRSLASDDPQERREAAHLLAIVTPAATEALPALALAAAADGASEYDSATIHAILAISPTSPEARGVVPMLIARLNPGTPSSIQHEAMGDLARLGPLAAPAVSSLRASLATENMELRQQAARTLRTIGPDAQPALADLARLARDLITTNQQNMEMRQQAARMLRMIGPDAQPTLADLAGLARDLMTTNQQLDVVDAVFVIDAASPEAASVLLHLARMYAERQPAGYSTLYQDLLSSYAKTYPATIPRVEEIARSGEGDDRSLAADVLRLIQPPQP